MLFAAIVGCLSFTAMHQLLILPITRELENKRRAYYQLLDDRMRTYHFLDMKKNIDSFTKIYIRYQNISIVRVSVTERKIIEMEAMMGNLTPEKALETTGVFFPAKPILSERECHF